MPESLAAEMESSRCPIHRAVIGKSEDRRRGVPWFKREICGIPSEPMACVVASGCASRYANAAAFSTMGAIVKNRAAKRALLSVSRPNRQASSWGSEWPLPPELLAATRAFRACLRASPRFPPTSGRQMRIHFIERRKSNSNGYFLLAAGVLVRECLHLMKNTSHACSFTKIGAGRYGPRHVLSISDWRFFEHPMHQQVAAFCRPVHERHELQRKQY
jgi:hypothetical protein